MVPKEQLYKDLQINVIGTDMSSTFDSIKQELLMKVMGKILNEDELRMS